MPKRLLALLVTCRTCGREFHPDKWTRTYCSRECWRKATENPIRRNCLLCGREFKPKQAQTLYCGKRCASTAVARARPNSRGWYRTVHGYILIRMPDHPQATRQGYVFQHRLVAEQKIGRPLTAEEVVHHLNGIKDDNRPENLEVLEKRVHDGLRNPRYMATCPECRHVFPVRGNAHTVDRGSS